MSSLLVAMKALLYSLSIDRGEVGAFLGCFGAASIINLSVFGHGVTEKVCSNDAWLTVL